MSKLSIILAVLLLTGCATASYQEILQRASVVNTADGVSKEEAVLLAQKYVIENSLDNDHGVNMIGKVRYWKDDDVWWVDFGSRYGFFSKEGYRFTLQVWVSATTGKIKTYCIRKY